MPAGRQCRAELVAIGRCWSEAVRVRSRPLRAGPPAGTYSRHRLHDCFARRTLALRERVDPSVGRARNYDVLSGGPVSRPMASAISPADRPLHPEPINILVQKVSPAGTRPVALSAHSLLAGS